MNHPLSYFAKHYRGQPAWRFYLLLRQHAELIQFALKSGPGAGAEIKYRLNITTRYYKKIVAFLGDHPKALNRAFKLHLWDEVEDIVFAGSGPGFRRLPSYHYVIELLKVTCPHQFYRYKKVEPMAVESAMAENATPPPQTEAESQPPQIEVAFPPSPPPEPVSVQAAPALPAPHHHEVQTEWPEATAELLAVATLEPRLEQAPLPDPEPTGSPTAEDASQPIESERAPTEPPAPPIGSTPEAPPPAPSQGTSPVSPPSLTLEKVERWIRIGLAAEAYLTPAGLRRLLGEEDPRT